MMFKKIIDFVHDFYKNIVYHTPKEELNDSEVEEIELNGLIHFCNSKNADNILQEGVKGGLKAPLLNAEKNFTWYYINEEQNFEKNKDTVHRKGKRKDYDMCIIIKGLTEEQLRKLRIRRKLDGAVIYPGTLKTNDMEAESITPS